MLLLLKANRSLLLLFIASWNQTLYLHFLIV